jgi:PIN domain nuclease of toxin-antitoxin system
VKLLLDTHVLLWALGAPGRLPRAAREEIEDATNEVLYSAASIWEIAIKAGLGRAGFSIDPVQIEREARHAGFTELPIAARHAMAVHGLPPHHNDPYDRLLLAQALIEPAWLYTADKQLARYDGPLRLLTSRT